MQLAFIISILALMISGCTSSVTDSKPKEAGSTAESLTPVNCAEGEECFCELPDGRQVADGQTISMFQRQRASCSSTCANEQVEVTCRDGRFELIPGYSYLTCEESTCEACELPWGEELAEGAMIEVYRRDRVGCTETCQSSTVRCVNSRLVGANLSTFSHPTCEVTTCIQCETPWGDLVQDGERIRMFKEETVLCGNRCESRSLTCSAGEFDAALLAEYNKADCQVENCERCNTPWGAVLNNGQQVLAFRNESVPCGESCSDPGNMAPRACVDGVLTGSTAHNFGSCAPRDCEDGGGAPGFVCRVPWSGASMLAGTRLTAYSKNEVGCNESCDDHMSFRTCQLEDGLLSGNPAAIFSTCARNCTCELESSSSTRTIPGGTRVLYRKQEVQCGEPDCSAQRYEATCQADGTFDGPGNYESHYCVNRCRCTNPATGVANIHAGNGIWGYTQATADLSNGENCNDFRVRRICQQATGQLDNPQAVHTACVNQ